MKDMSFPLLKELNHPVFKIVSDEAAVEVGIIQQDQIGGWGIVHP